MPGLLLISYGLRRLAGCVLPELQREVGKRQAAHVLRRQPEVAWAAPIVDGLRRTATHRLCLAGGYPRQAGLAVHGLGEVSLAGHIAEDEDEPVPAVGRDLRRPRARAGRVMPEVDHVAHQPARAGRL